MTNDDLIDVVAIKKPDGHFYIIMYDGHRKGDALRVLGQFAANPDLSFSWHDAAVLSQRIRSLSGE